MTHPSKKSSSSSHLLFLEHHFEFLVLTFFFGHSCTREKPIISQWRGRFRLRQTLFSLRFLLHCRPCPLWPSSPSLFFPSSLLWNRSVHQEKKGNECTLDSALNRLTHFIDDADDRLMILIKIGSWQADYVSIWIWLLWCLSAQVFMFHTELVCCRRMNLCKGMISKQLYSPAGRTNRHVKSTWTFGAATVSSGI